MYLMFTIHVSYDCASAWVHSAGLALDSLKFIPLPASVYLAVITIVVGDLNLTEKV